MINARNLNNYKSLIIYLKVVDNYIVSDDYYLLLKSLEKGNASLCNTKLDLTWHKLKERECLPSSQMTTMREPPPNNQLRRLPPRSPLSPNPLLLSKISSRRDQLLPSPPRSKISMPQVNLRVSPAKTLPEAAEVVVEAAVAEAALEAKAVVDSEVKVVVDSEAVKDVPVQRALKAKERDAQELKAEKAVDAAEVAQDHPELRVVKEPKKVVMKALSMSKERKELTTKAKSTDSEERRENSGTHMIEKTELAEVEESIREVLERATGELLLMKPRSLKLPRAKKLLRRLPLRARQQLRSKKSMLPLRKKRRLQLRRKRTQSN